VRDSHCEQNGGGLTVNLDLMPQFLQ